MYQLEKPTVKILNTSDYRMYAWLTSRDETVSDDIRELKNFNTSLQDLHEVVVHFNASAGFRELLTGLRPYGMWSTSSRNRNIRSINLAEYHSEDSYKNLIQSMELVYAKTQEFDQDYGRMYLPLAHMGEFIYKASVRLFLSVYQTLKEIGGSEHLYIKLYLKPLFNQMGIDPEEYHYPGVSKEFGLQTSAFEFTEGVSRFQGIVTVAAKMNFGMRTHLVRQSRLQVRDTIWDQLEALGVEGYEQQNLMTPIELVVVMTENAYKATAAKRSCFTGDTKISLLNGEECRLDELVAGEKLYVYGCQEDGTIQMAEAIALGITNHVKELVQVTLDTNKVVKCTEDHLWMLRDGTYRRADKLKEGDSLMPLYRELDKRGYERYFDNKVGKYRVTHRRVSRDFMKGEMLSCWEELKGSGSPSKRIVLHHKDRNKRNNEPSNLQWMGDYEHIVWHGQFGRELMNKLWEDPEWREFKEKHNATLGIQYGWIPSGNHRFKIPEIYEDQIKLASELMTERMQEPEFRALALKNFEGGPKWKDHWEDPKFRSEQTERARLILLEAWKNPEYREQHIEIGRKSMLSWRNTEKGKAAVKEAVRKSNKLRGQYKRSGIADELSYKEWKLQENHKVLKVEFLKFEEKIPVYDINVPETANFALSAGVFVHNCFIAQVDLWYGFIEDEYKRVGFPNILPCKGKRECCTVKIEAEDARLRQKYTLPCPIYEGDTRYYYVRRKEARFPKAYALMEDYFKTIDFNNSKKEPGDSFA